MTKAAERWTAAIEASEFCLADGAVVGGPATTPRPRFETRAECAVEMRRVPDAGDEALTPREIAAEQVHPQPAPPAGARRASSDLAAVLPRLMALLAVIPLLAACDDLQFPGDPEGTLKSVVSGGEMTVAVSLNPPWTVMDRDGELSGVEVELVEDFADQLGARIEWRRLDAFAALASLEQDDVDLAIGGFARKDVMPIAGAAPSYVFYEEESILALRGESPDDVEPHGDRVFVPQHLPLAELVRDEGGHPVDEWSKDVNFAAVPRWQAAALGLTPVDVILHRAHHVVAVRQGENAWLMEVERFFRSEASNMDERLRANQR